MPPHTRIAPHTHRDERFGVVVSGVWFFGYGATATTAGTQALTPGAFYTEPGGAPHFAFTREQPAVVYITGYGPTNTVFVNAEGAGANP